jgi:hypothetical protein
MPSGAAPATYIGWELKPDTSVRVDGDPFKAKTRFLKEWAKVNEDGLNDAFNQAQVNPPSFGLLNNTATLKGEINPVGGDPPPDKINLVTDRACDGDPEFPSCSGRWNTTAGEANGPWWETKTDFTISFNEAIRAFGFFATDLGDFGAQVSIELFSSTTPGGTAIEKICFFEDPKDSSNRCTVYIPVAEAPSDSTIDGEGRPNGNLLFFGFGVTETSAFRSIRFNIGQGVGSPDYVGFDDFVTAARVGPPVDVPEPATLALVAASLAGLVATRRRPR